MLLGGAERRVVISGRLELELVGASESANAPAVAANTGAEADEPSEKMHYIDDAKKYTMFADSLQTTSKCLVCLYSGYAGACPSDYMIRRTDSRCLSDQHPEPEDGRSYLRLQPVYGVK